MKRWFFLAIAATSVLFVPSASALKVIETDKVYIYYPDEAGPLAQNLLEAYSHMAAFLAEKGLPVKTPVHIILDKNRDLPRAVTQIYPHREIRLPLRAPGVFEDGYTETDPWRYYMFKGLCELAIYSERSGLPAGFYYMFGEIVSPNIILPEWSTDGVGNLLYELYSLHDVTDPLAEAIFKTGDIPSLDLVSHRPEIWPGQFSFRIYGRPFIKWLHQRYGWQRMLHFIQLHGRGILPIEIDFKAHRAFGKSWNQLWESFRREYVRKTAGKNGKPIVGFWDSPNLYWNDQGVYPGAIRSATRSRYGFLDPQDWLWTSEYVKGRSKIKIQKRGAVRNLVYDHVWDPGTGSIAVGRRGTTPELVLFSPRKGSGALNGVDETVPVKTKIIGPPGAIQMSGPVLDDRGRVAVAANLDGNWDIWVYDGNWHRVTDAPSIEADPWFIDGKLIFSSNSTGRFQIHGSTMTQLTQTATAALLPRNSTFLQLDGAGWQLKAIDQERIPPLTLTLTQTRHFDPKSSPAQAKSKNYSAWKSIWPNFVAPDYFISTEDFQLGLATQAYDVSRKHKWNAGFRYDFDEGEVTWRLGYRRKPFSSRITRYPLRYTTRRGSYVDERRLEVNVSWTPQSLKELTVAANFRRYAADRRIDFEDEDWWASIAWKDQLKSVYGTINLDAFSDGSQSVYGELLYWFGEKINTVTRIRGGKTWGDLDNGHNTFRIGGNVAEGYFTQRYSRLFALRGFDSNVLEAGQAGSASLNILWPFAKLQSGYKTLPLFLHNITLNTFVDAGFAADEVDSEEVLVGAGFEIITGMQLAWDSKSNFSMGVAWPLKKPADVKQDGPIFLFLIGRPL